MVSKAKAKLISKATMYDGLPVRVIRKFDNNATPTNGTKDSHLHDLKPIPDINGNRAQRREAERQLRKKKK